MDGVRVMTANDFHEINASMLPAEFSYLEKKAIEQAAERMWNELVAQVTNSVNRPFWHK